MHYQEALSRMHQPRPDFVSVSSLMALFGGGSSAELTRAQHAAWQAEPGNTAHADRVVEHVGDAPAPFLRFLIGDFYEHVGAHEASLTAVARAAAETPCWDPMLVAWAYNGIAAALGHLGRKEEARAVLEQLWAFDPFYPNALETAHAVGAEPPAVPAPRGQAASLRLSVAQQVYEDNREPGFRATAMAMSFVWEGQHVAAASLAELGEKLEGPNPAWPRAIAAYARAQSSDAPGTLPRLPAGTVSARLKAVRAAHKAKNLPLLEVCAHDPEFEVARAAWASLLELGHRGEELAALIRELGLAMRGPRQTYRAHQIAEVLDSAPLPAVSAVALVERAISAVKAGALVSLPLEPGKATAPAPPSLAAWLRFGGLDELEPGPVLKLVQRAHGELFDALPAKLAGCPALPLALPETVNDCFEVLLLAHADSDGETPVLAFDVADGPTVTVIAESFAAWLAEDVGLGKLRPNAATKRAAKAILGKAKLVY